MAFLSKVYAHLEVKAASVDVCYRGYANLLPPEIKPFFKSDSNFAYGKGDYYSVDRRTAERYGYKDVKYGTVVAYKIPTSNIVTIEDKIDFKHRGDLAFHGKLNLTESGKSKLKID